MYLAIDVGGTKTLVASFTNDGKLSKSIKFKTPTKYDDFLGMLRATTVRFSDFNFRSACVGLPGVIDRKTGTGIAFGNLKWASAPIKHDLASFIHCPIIVENDANLAGLAVAQYFKDDYKKILYLTISTGIGAGIITDGIIDPDLSDTEPGQMMIQYNDKRVRWEKVASGSAIKLKYGKLASEINSKKDWSEVAHLIAIGINNLLAIIQPDIVVIGGGVGSHLHKYKAPLKKELKKLSTPLTPVPPIVKAKHAQQAVVYGCYELAKDWYEQTH